MFIPLDAIDKMPAFAGWLYDLTVSGFSALPLPLKYVVAIVLVIVVGQAYSALKNYFSKHERNDRGP